MMSSGMSQKLSAGVAAVAGVAVIGVEDMSLRGVGYISYALCPYMLLPYIRRAQTFNGKSPARMRVRMLGYTYNIHWFYLYYFLYLLYILIWFYFKRST